MVVVVVFLGSWWGSTVESGRLCSGGLGPGAGVALGGVVVVLPVLVVVGVSTSIVIPASVWMFAGEGFWVLGAVTSSSK